jgi:hypothetical protein
MTLITFDFVLEDVLCVHQVGVIIFFQPFSFSMTLVTILPRNFAISEDCVAVAFVAGKSIIEDQGMIITGRHLAHEGFLCVAVAAIIDLRIVFAFFKVTDKTGALRDSDMLSLHDLGVTTCALELFSPF